MREKCEDVRADGGRDVGWLDLCRSAEFLDERLKVANKAVVAEASEVLEKVAGEEVGGIV